MRAKCAIGISKQKPISISCFDRPKSPKIRHHIAKNRRLTPGRKFKRLSQQSRILSSAVKYFDFRYISRSQALPIGDNLRLKAIINVAFSRV